MSSRETTTGRKTNAEVARAMLIVGITLIGVALVVDFFAQNWYEWLNSLNYTLRDVLTRVLSLVVRAGYPVGGILIVGSIIVNRLPERNQ